MIRVVSIPSNKARPKCLVWADQLPSILTVAQYPSNCLHQSQPVHSIVCLYI